MMKHPEIKTILPGPKTAELIDLDTTYVCLTLFEEVIRDTAECMVSLEMIRLGFVLGGKQISDGVQAAINIGAEK